jgi:hypothetical protein
MLVGSLARTKIPMMPAPIPARSAIEFANRRRASACRYPWCRLSLSDFGIYLSVGDGAAQCASRRVGQFRFRYSLPVVFATALRRPKSVKAALHGRGRQRGAGVNIRAFSPKGGSQKLS